LQLAVAQYEDATDFNIHSIDGDSGQRIESVLNHHCLRAHTDNHTALGATGTIPTVACVLHRLKPGKGVRANQKHHAASEPDRKRR
jgi:hypothetical protein